MEVVKIKKMGYPFRETFEEFWTHRCLTNKYYKFVDGVDELTDAKEGTRLICEAVLRSPEEIKDEHTGKTSTKYFWVRDSFLTPSFRRTHSLTKLEHNTKLEHK